MSTRERPQARGIIPDLPCGQSGAGSTHAVPQVVGERQVPREGVGERVVEVEHLHQPVALHDVQVAVRERAHVRHRLADGRLAPKLVPEHVPSACGTDDGGVRAGRARGALGRGAARRERSPEARAGTLSESPEGRFTNERIRPCAGIGITMAEFRNNCVNR